MPLTFVMVCEAQPDFQTAAGLADRVLCENVDWIDTEVINAYRQFVGNHTETPYLTWAESANLAKALGRRAHGHFEGKPGDLDAIAGRKAILIVLDKFPEATAIFLVRDSDGRTARLEGLNQARAEVKTTEIAIVIGVAHCKREAWILSGFLASQEDEKQQIQRLRQELGFDPCERNHELDAMHDHDKRSAKRVLFLLTGGDKARETHCAINAPLDLLAHRGQNNGLASYLAEVKDRVVKLFVAA
jgi:hypothetical protein